MEFRILGPLEVLDDGRVLELGGQKQRALLAVLLLHANEVVSSDRLIEAVWEERPPPTAGKALQVYVSQLRKLLGNERVQTKTPGYLLRVGSDELDLERCRRLLADGRPGEALALWRGPPLDEFAYQRFAQAETARLVELRLNCVEERIEQDLAEGRHAELVGELEMLVAEHPLRERLRGQLMLTLYRSGRQAEALEVYQDGRRLYADELGLEPGETLKALQKAILAHDPALDPPTAREPAPDLKPEHERPFSADSEPREVRKTVTVLSLALEPTAGTEAVDPEAQRRTVKQAFAEIQAAVDNHGGTIEAISGQAVTAVFGVPAIHEDDALRAVRAAVELRGRLQAHQPSEGLIGRLDVRVGLSTGKVVTGGSDASIQSTGRPLIDATRLAQTAGQGELLLDESTYRLVRHAVDVETRDQALRLLELRAGVPLVRSRFDAPMIGRKREQRRLRDAFEQAVGDQSCQLFTILGTAGVGKSRLVREFLADVGVEAVVVRGRCLPYGEGITYFPLMEAVQELAGLDAADPPEDVLSKLAAKFEKETDADVLARRVGELIGLTEVGVTSQESFAAVQALFETVARRTSLVVVFDDIHWGESTFLDLIEHLADWIRDAPVLLVCIARPELIDVRAGWGGGKLNATSILLEPLSNNESAQLVDNLVGSAGIDRSARNRIVEAADGNPLFLEEMLALATEDGRDINELVMPPTIQALLAARLDRLDHNERSVIEHAAVEGKVFFERAVSELAPEALRPAVTAAFGSLVRKELIRPDRPGFGGPTYRFRHLLIRDAAYDAIPKVSRVGMHERFGRWLERATGERSTEYEEVVGYHLEQAYRYQAELGTVDESSGFVAREAAERLGSAGRRAFVRSDGPAGVNLISRAVSLLSPEDPLRVELVPNVRVIQGLSGDLSWADRVLTDAIEAAATTGDRSLAAHALVQRGLLRLFTEAAVTPDELLEVADRSIRVFDELRDELGLARAWRLRAQAHYLARRAAACAKASEQALEHSRRAGSRFEQQEIVEWLVIALLLGPTPASEAAERCRRLLHELSPEPRAEAEILAGLAGFKAMMGHTTDANEIMIGVRHKPDEHIWLASLWAGFISMWRGDPLEAEHELRPAYDALKKIGEKSHFSSMAHALANAVYAQGRYSEAEQLTHECERACRANDIHSQINWRSIRAKALARRGDPNAEQLAQEAVAFAEATDFLPAHADALANLAEVLELRGEHATAHSAAREALALHQQKGNTLAADQIAELLPESGVDAQP
jgi:DNA-binding SARP family transcriptional activator/tetratricopeptide (TPR) repeat protein